MMALKAAPPGNHPAPQVLHLTRTATPSASTSRIESIASSALQCLHQSPYRGLRSVALDVSGNTMILTGQVRTFFLKQMAQHLLGDYSGTWEIKNDVRVA